MRTLRRAGVALAALATLGAVSSAQTITVKRGDSVFVGFAVRNDSGVKVFRGGASFTLCGSSVLYARFYHDAKLTVPLDAHSVAVAIPCPGDTTKVAATSEPVFDSTKATMLLRDNFDGYANTAALMPPCQQLSGPRFYDRAWDTCAIGGVPDTNRVFLIPGRGTSGKAIRISYTGTYQESWNITAGGFPDTGPNTAIVTVWSRLTGSIGAIKWIELFHNTGGRIQFNTHDNLPCNLGTHPLVWQVYDLAQTTCQGNQPLGPYPTQLVDGQWHRYTYLYKPNSVAGARDGRALMWIDGLLVIDIEKSMIGVTPAGGEKPWCQGDDVDALSTNGFVEANFGGPLTTTPGPFTYDIDDFQLWKLKAA